MCHADSVLWPILEEVLTPTSLADGGEGHREKGGMPLFIRLGKRILTRIKNTLLQTRLTTKLRARAFQLPLTLRSLGSRSFAADGLRHRGKS